MPTVRCYSCNSLVLDMHPKRLNGHWLCENCYARATEMPVEDQLGAFMCIYCHKFFSSTKATVDRTPASSVLCPECARVFEDRYGRCPICGRIHVSSALEKYSGAEIINRFPELEDEINPDKDYPICSVCYSDYFSIRCAECGRYHSSTTSTFVDGMGYLCPMCAEPICAYSGDRFQPYSGMIDSYGNYACEACNGTYGRCNSCGNPCLLTDLEDGVCPSCLKLQATKIMSYSYKPNPKFRKAKKAESTPPYERSYGIELELELINDLDINENDNDIPPEDPEYRDDCVAELIDMVKDDDGYLFYAKEDGSLTWGVEFVSHPMSLKYLYEKEDMLTSFLERAKRLGFRGFQTDTAGIHIHTGVKGLCETLCSGRESYSTFISRLVAYQLMAMEFYSFKKITRRDPGDSHYASRLTLFDNMFPSSTHTISSIASGAFRKAKSDRYNWLNATEARIGTGRERAEGTLEYRSFKSTLYPLGFLSSFEFVDIMNRIAARATTGAMKPRDFIANFPEAFMEMSKEYKYLPEYISERGFSISAPPELLEGRLPFNSVDTTPSDISIPEPESGFIIFADEYTDNPF